MRADFEGRLSRNEFLQAASIHARQPRNAMLTRASVSVFGMITLAGIALSYENLFILAIVLIPLWVVLWNSRLLFARLQASSQWQRQPVVRGTLKGRLDETGLTINTGAGRTSVPWKQLAGFRANSRMVLLYHEEHVYNVLPRRVFGTDEAWQLVQTLVGNNTALLAGKAPGTSFWIMAGVSLVAGIGAWLTILI